MVYSVCLLVDASKIITASERLNDSVTEAPQQAEPWVKVSAMILEMLLHA